MINKYSVYIKQPVFTFILLICVVSLIIYFDRNNQVQFPSDAGAVMSEFKYYVNFNQEFKEATTSVFCKGRVECFSTKSRFKLTKTREMKEGDVLFFYLIGYKKAGNFQIERAYEASQNYPLSCC